MRGNNTYLCNTIDSTYRGMDFNGDCDNSALQSNKLGRHYVGLYLGTSTRIGQQPVGGNPPYSGNTWKDTTKYSSGYGAVNLNTNLGLSLFTTNQYETSTNPKIPLTSGYPFYVNNSGWFDRLPAGATYSCDSSNLCGTNNFSEGSQGLREYVAAGNDVSADFIDESKAIAAQNLFADLKEKPALAANSTLLQDFVAENQTAAIGKIYDTKNEIDAIHTLDATDKNTMATARELIKNKMSELAILDSTLSNGSDSILLQERIVILNEIDVAYANMADVIAQKSGEAVANIINATNYNAAVVTGEKPLAYEKMVATIQLDYEQNGIVALQNHSVDLYTVANDCPMSGGPAVFKARHFVRELDENVEYNDEANCLQLGYYRKSGTKTKNHDSKFSVIPNPANEKIDIQLTSLFTGICKVSIKNAESKEVFTAEFDCKLTSYSIFTGKFANGIYSVSVSANDNVNEIVKLVIIK